MKFVIFLFCIVAWVSVESQAEQDVQFRIFKEKFGKSYKNALEEHFRSKVFASNLKIIVDHNKLYQNGQSTFELGVTQFADLTTAEFAANYLGKYKSRSPNRLSAAIVKAVPDSIDWRDEGYVGPVQNQGQCGAAWTFATTGALEGQNFAATGTYVKLSEQNLADCTYDVAIGCTGGGFVDDGFQYVIDNGGIDTEVGYPVISDETCHYDPAAKGGTASSYVDNPSKDENALKEACGTYGPIATYLDASHASFQLYVAGIYYEPACSEDTLDHTGLIVGYGSEEGNDYWIVKNTWGVSWGEQGYIRMARNKGNNCGIATMSSYPVV